MYTVSATPNYCTQAPRKNKSISFTVTTDLDLLPFQKGWPFKFSKTINVTYFKTNTSTLNPCLVRVYGVMDARGNFGDHERSVRVARGTAEIKSSFMSALPQTSQVHASITRCISADLKA